MKQHELDRWQRALERKEQELDEREDFLDATGPGGVVVDRDQMLLAMRMAAYLEAESRMSQAGKETLQMFSTAIETLDVEEAFGEFTAHEELDEEEWEALRMYANAEVLCRRFQDYEEE